MMLSRDLRYEVKHLGFENFHYSHFRFLDDIGPFSCKVNYAEMRLMPVKNIFFALWCMLENCIQAAQICVRETPKGMLAILASGTFPKWTQITWNQPVKFKSFLAGCLPEEPHNFIAGSKLTSWSRFPSANNLVALSSQLVAFFFQPAVLIKPYSLWCLKA